MLAGVHHVVPDLRHGGEVHNLIGTWRLGTSDVPGMGFSAVRTLRCHDRVGFLEDQVRDYHRSRLAPHGGLPGDQRRGERQGGAADAGSRKRRDYLGRVRRSVRFRPGRGCRRTRRCVRGEVSVTSAQNVLTGPQLVPVFDPENASTRLDVQSEREPGESPGLSRSGMQERPPSTSTGHPTREATASRSTTRVCACESEDLPAVPGAPRLAAHRLVEWAYGCRGCSSVLAAQCNRVSFASAGGDHPVD